MDPHSLRQYILAKRDALSGDDQLRYSTLITKRAVELEQFKSAKTIFIYVNFRSEVATCALIDHMLMVGKRVVVPVTQVKEKTLLPVVITDPERQLAPGYCSIPEPITEIRKDQLVVPGIIDLIFLPGSVFDERGEEWGTVVDIMTVSFQFRHRRHCEWG